MNRLAIVTVTYNAEKNLGFFLPSLIKNKDVVNSVYFVDNSSSDKTLETLNSFICKNTTNIIYNITKNTKNYGYAYAVNLGIQKALDDGFEYICVTNNDIIFNEGFFSQILKDAIENNTDATGVPASINNDDLGFGYVLDKDTNSPKNSKPIKRELLEQEILKNPTPSTDFPHGGTILFSKHFFESIGLYDSGLFFGGDELDFLYRVKKYNEKNTREIRCVISLKSFLLMDNLTKHNSGHKIKKAKGMLQGNARVNLKHKFTPLNFGLYKEQYHLIKILSKGKIIRYILLYIFSIRGLSIEIFKNCFK